MTIMMLMLMITMLFLLVSELVGVVSFMHVCAVCIDSSVLSCVVRVLYVVCVDGVVCVARVFVCLLVSCFDGLLDCLCGGSGARVAVAVFATVVLPVMCVRVLLLFLCWLPVWPVGCLSACLVVLI